MEKPVFGPMVRALMIAATALFAVYHAAGLKSDSLTPLEYPKASQDSSVWIMVWVIALFYVVLAGWIAYRVVRERFPPPGVYVFPALAINPFGELVMSITGGLLLLVTPLLLMEVPLMRAEAAAIVAYGGSVPYSKDWVSQAGPLVILFPAAIMLLLWRPIYFVAPGKPIVRYRIGGWLPWTQRFEQAPALQWTVYYGGGRYQRYPIGHMLQGTAGKKSFDIVMVGLDWPEPEKDRLRAEWHARLTGASAPR